MIGEWEYCADLFGETTIRRMSDHFRTLLNQIVADPEKPVTRMSMLTDTEYDRIVCEWNDTATDSGQPQTVHALFEEQVDLDPNAIALVQGDKQLTYREVNERANQLAHYLREIGVGTETPVGTCMHRSMELIIATLAIIKAGGAYVPLDPAYPAERLALMIEDTGLTFVLTHAGSGTNLSDQVCLDVAALNLCDQPKTNPVSGTTTDNLLHIIYTSGSTGRPKGIEIVHCNVQRLVKGTRHAPLDRNQTFLHLASPSFDATTFEVWSSLCNGARLVIYPDTHLDLPLLARIIREQRVSVLLLTTALFHLMVDDYLDALAGVDHLLVGGEVASVPHVRKMLDALAPQTVYVASYGPAESATLCTTMAMTDRSMIRTSVPIGAPISNTQVYIMDEACQLSPVGVPGELYTGGAGLARGYRNRPELTAQRFINHPRFGRLYRTGDLCRWRSDGMIEFLGRTDFQVKIRGFRIEPGEIERVLAQHPSVREAVVMVYDDISNGVNEKRLVAYVTADDSPELTGSLKAHLQAQLPDYMVPRQIMVLASLPMTPNGKLDRKALPVPEILPSASFEPPATPTEIMLAAIWAEVLKRPNIGRHDNFFELGGHSLLATQVVTRIRNQVGANLPVRSMFASPTLRSLADDLDVYEWAQAGTVGQ